MEPVGQQGGLGPEELLREGMPDAALAALQARVRGAPASPALRVFLFQLLCVQGDWPRAQAQLTALGDLDARAFPLVHRYGAAVTCELLRREVFAGTRTPLVLGELLPWISLLLEALTAEARGRSGEAGELRAQALEQAHPVPGAIDGEPFGWIADADPRLGPVCEAMIDGRYYWVPFERLRAVGLEAPSDLRDVVWMPAHLDLAGGGEAAALLPARYPGSESDSDGMIRLGRRTEWDEVAPETFHGRGQRMLATDVNDYPLLDVRRIEFREAA
jgi:type VI secretion system protein ImpE